ncbi:MAG TPA: helix-turn-helix transcriptional regulator [Candidatus Gordonibacter avicola]|nr:helix-turn-helix transcriptional regulator [Candidatus Gordonibacter avicola]
MEDHGVAAEKVCSDTGLKEDQLERLKTSEGRVNAVRLTTLAALVDSIGCDVGELFEVVDDCVEESRISSSM